MKINSEEVLNNAKLIGDQYLKAFDCTGDYDLKKIKKALEGRIHEGHPVEIVVVKSPDEAIKVIKKKIEETGAQVNPYNCIWDYYLMAFYHAAYAQCPDQSHEFGRQNFLEAFKNGLGFYINLGNFAVAITRPMAKRDDQLRIHCQDGPAIIWGKTKQYFWHGVEVPGEWIEKKNEVDPKLCLNYDNIEQRRALCEIIGWNKVLELLDAKPIQKDKFGELLEVNLPDAGTTRFVKVLCGTGRTFAIPVPATCKTAHEAVAASYSLSVEEYNPEVRT